MNDPRRFRRGAIWRVRLDPVEGSEQGGTCPVVIVSSDLLNDVLPIVTIAPITSRKTDRVFKTEVLIEPTEGGLTQRSKIILYQTRAITKARAVEELGNLTDPRMAEVDTALRRALSLDG
jgi:mRNA interferase MazF